MPARNLTKLRTETASLLDDVVGTLGNAWRRRWCETYVRGVLFEGPRKNIEPMADRLQKIEQGSEDYEQALQQFINQSPGDEQVVLDGLLRRIGRRFGVAGSLSDDFFSNIVS